MGAYYQAVLKYPEDDRWLGYSTWKFDNGAKLMEHSYILNTYTNFITYKIYYKPAHLVWLCDYHEEEDFNWDTIPEGKIKKSEIKKARTALPCVLYVNLTRREYFSLKKILQIAGKSLMKIKPPFYAELHRYKNTYFTTVIHPLPLLTNSETESAGGGDYYPDYKLRSHWAEDLIVALPDSAELLIKKYGFKDISTEVPVEIDDYDSMFGSFRGEITFALAVLDYIKKMNVLNNPERAIINELTSISENGVPRLVFRRANYGKVKEILKEFC